jgi:glucose/arabinose dehydrogenase
MKRIIYLLVALVPFLAMEVSAADGFAVEADIWPAFKQPMDLAMLGEAGVVVVERCGNIIFASMGGKTSKLGTLKGAVNCEGADRGLVGVALPPKVNMKDFLYVYYHLKNKKAQQVSRIPLTRNGDTIKLLMTEETPLLEKIPAYVDGHQGGALRIRGDGTLIIGVGDDGPANAKLAQDLTVMHGKILRINTDGSIPDDNPFADMSNKTTQKIFAWGLNQPMSVGIDTNLSNRIWIGDQAESKVQEVNLTLGGENFGWPKYEGSKTHHANPEVKMTPPDPTKPVHEYDYGLTSKGAVTVGQPYRNKDGKYAFPKWFAGAVPVADFWQYWVKFLIEDEGTWKVNSYEPGPTNVRAMVNGDDGAIYLISQNKLVRMYWIDQSPTAKFVFPKTGYRYSAGEVLEMEGTGSDKEDGVLSEGFKWWVVLRNSDDKVVETKKFKGETATYTLPDSIDIEGYLNIKLRVFDSMGGYDDADLKIFPVASKITFDSDPTDIDLTIDGETLTPPIERTYVKDTKLSVSCALEVYLGEEGEEELYIFEEWSDGGEREHLFVVPAEDMELTCRYKLHGPPPVPDEPPVIIDFGPTITDEGSQGGGEDSGCTVSNHGSPLGMSLLLLLLMGLISRGYATRQRRQSKRLK